jgi:hypothetical protein
LIEEIIPVVLLLAEPPVLLSDCCSGSVMRCCGILWRALHYITLHFITFPGSIKGVNEKCDK